MIGDAFYRPLKGSLLGLLKVPVEPPEPPVGSDASVLVFRASPRFLKYRLVLLGIFAAAVVLGLCVALVATAAAGEPGGAVFFVVLLLVSVPCLVFAAFCIRVEYDLRYYILTDRSLRVREGALILQERTLTYANVQNLSIHQGPIQRLLGIADLQVDTAGGGGSSNEQKQGITRSHGARIAGVENAHEVRDRVLTYLRAQRDTGLGDPDDARRARRRPARAGAGAGARVSADALAALREVAAEARALRAAAEGAAGA